MSTWNRPLDSSLGPFVTPLSQGARRLLFDEAGTMSQKMAQGFGTSTDRVHQVLYVAGTRVRMATRALVEAGELVPEPCRVCGSLDVEAHHPHYDREDSHMVVDWLCKAHHALEHGQAAWTFQLDMFPQQERSI